ncbi:MAG: CRISPR-associated protein Cas4 [Chloroflexaceae bacterium]|nr:CRISPR-associated protein Cas4 [Chloroflexaceae bacterium]
MTEATLLEVTDLKQWRYCGRIVWYRFCLPDIRPVTALMEQGQVHHRDEVGREERRSLRTYGLKEGERAFDVRLVSERLGLVGRLDLAIAVPSRSAAGAEAVVVEYKDTEGKAGPHVKLQLAAYAVLVEECWGLPVRVGYIYHLPVHTTERVAITPPLRRQVGDTVAAIQAAIRREQLPPPPASKRLCAGCEFRRFCNDVV